MLGGQGTLVLGNGLVVVGGGQALNRKWSRKNTVMGLKVSLTLPPWCEHLRTGPGENDPGRLGLEDMDTVGWSRL